MTIKQERFVQELVKGKSQREAYKAAYNAEGMKPKTIDCKASLLFNRGDIRARYDELMAQATGSTADDAVSIRAFIIEKYKAIASGELCETTKEYDADGTLLKYKKSIRPNDVNNALQKLAEFYGVQPTEEQKQEINIVLHGAEDYAD